MSTYIVSREPRKFVGGQEHWMRRSDEVVQKAAGDIRQAMDLGSDLRELFHRLLTEFSQQRAAIAMEPYRLTGIDPRPQDRHFGKRRDLEGKKLAYLTVLEKEYAEYNRILLEALRDKLKSMGAATRKVWQDACDGVETSLELEVLDGAALTSRRWIEKVTNAELPSDFPIDLADKREQLNDEENKALKAANKVIRQEKPELYQRLVMSVCFERLQQEFPVPPDHKGDHPNRKSRFVVGTAKMRIGGEMRVVSRYLTWLYVSGKPGENMFDRMVNCSKMILIHTDNFDIPERLQECARIFARAVQAEEPVAIKQQLKRFTFTFGGTMPDERGSAAQNEWFLLAIAAAKRMRLTFSDKQLGDLEALTRPLYSDFSASFERGFELEASVPAAAAAAAAH